MRKDMKLVIRSTLFVVVLTILLGGVYPAAVTAVSRLFWKDKANGSFLTDGRRVVGSELIGQNFQRPEYLHPRPSAAGKDGYDATASGGRNKGPIDADLATSVRAAIAAARADRPGDSRPVPADLATASSSGLDPHISPDAAAWQALRVARARGLTEDQVLEVIRRNTEPRTLILLGEPRVNVLRTNLALDRAFPGR
jgi:potassium-transporting ATPase KdpC subunit